MALEALTTKPLFSRVWLACLGCPCPSMPVQRWGEASGGKSHLERGSVHESCTEMPRPSCSAKPHCFGMPSSPTSCPACTHSFCGNKQVKIKWAQPGGRLLSAIYREQISFLCKYHFKANNFWGGKDTSQASVKQARSDLQRGKNPGFVL